MDFDTLRMDFPTVRNGAGIYLDSACQALRPDCVIRAMDEYYGDYPACGGRSVHSMASRVSLAVDETREALASFFGTDDPGCYVFTKNCTEGLNTAAFGLGLKKGDTVITTDSEHNSNHIPWLILQENAGIRRKYSRSAEDGSFDIEFFKGLFDSSVRAVSVQQSNSVTGQTLPVREIAEIARDYNAVVIIDGAQSAPHIPVDLKKIDADIFCFSIHKMPGPSGMGVMYGKKEVLENLNPVFGGGGTVGLVTYDSFTPAPVPDRFEAGLQNYAGIIGTKAALDYLSGIGMDNIRKHDSELMRRMMGNLEDIRNLHILGSSVPENHGSILSFNIDGLKPHDIAMMADSMKGIMIRSGMHCSHPFYVSRHIGGSARASVYLYNNIAEIDAFTDTVRHIADVFGE